MILGVIGYGAIAGRAIASLAQTHADRIEAIICLARPDGLERARAMLDVFPARVRCDAVCDPADLISRRPLVVAEAAGREALATHGERILASGCDLLVTSVGALADPAIAAALDRGCAKSGARYALCAGAIGGLDILDAATRSGLDSLVYTSRKPAAAWRGTPAEKLVALDDLAEAKCFFEGSAREAALLFPQNANVAATVALRGPGLDNTRARLVADPSITRNVHEIAIRSTCVDVDLRISGAPAPENPKTSMTTAYALASMIAGALDNERDFKAARRD